jgi:acid phosphatase
LQFLPPELPDTNSPVEFKVTSNTITSQVTGALFKGLYPSSATIVALQQIASSDSLTPGYPCPGADALRSAYQSTTNWTAHLNDPDTVALFKRLDAVSGVNPSDSGWHS